MEIAISLYFTLQLSTHRLHIYDLDVTLLCECKARSRCVITGPIKRTGCLSGEAVSEEQPLILLVLDSARYDGCCFKGNRDHHLPVKAIRPQNARFRWKIELNNRRKLSILFAVVKALYNCCVLEAKNVEMSVTRFLIFHCL